MKGSHFWFENSDAPRATLETSNSVGSERERVLRWRHGASMTISTVSGASFSSLPGPIPVLGRLQTAPLGLRLWRTSWALGGQARDPLETTVRFDEVLE